MNEVIRQLFERRSVRVFEERPILPEDKELILEAAMQAPTAGNQQLYTILDITEQKLKEQLAITCDNQPFIARAPMVLIFCADCKKWYDAYLAGGSTPRIPDAGDFLLAVSDANIAAQNAVVAAHSLGIGSCYIGDIMERYEDHAKILSLPPYVFPAAMLVFGYPTEQQKKRPKPARSGLPFIVHENGYHVMDEAELKEMLLPKTGVLSEAPAQEYDNWIQRFCERKYNADFSREMSRSVKAFLDTLGEKS